MQKLQITRVKYRHEGFHFVQCTCKLVALYNLFIFSSLFISGSANFYNRSSDRLEALNSQRSLDNVLQKYAFRACIHPKTGIIYDAQVPNNMSGIQVHAVRLRSGSLRSRGFVYNEFDIPAGVVVQPYVKRLVLVYQNLGNWSSLYYNNLGTNQRFKLVAPVLGLLAYNKSARVKSSDNLQEAHILATKKPINVRFTSVDSQKGLVVTPLCIFFNLNGSVSLSNMSSSYVCTTYYQGHFSLVIQSLAPIPAPSAGSIVSGFPSSPSSKKIPNSIPYVFPEKHESNTWKFALGSLLGGSMVLGVTGVFGFCLHKRRQKSMITRMEHRADQGEALQTALIGQSRAPTASGLRTHPKLENENIT
ncbi:hypothetical protein SUGI_0587980 [Cryptomeria japonica]|uniref:uncharacterized protein LOC131064195 n=1 Tax=Cryptomeria japonica TaxID=3369 RepID=UPI002414CACE|nr:uncharacterized protein LOC131064195 [Cryptomeria japonica]GLJ29774.1 hypothetical protein SUGI_0587980 [Cryptomeria japonica]